jgi:L,D-transpeptidase ErfK/SrfK
MRLEPRSGIKIKGDKPMRKVFLYSFAILAGVQLAHANTYPLPTDGNVIGNVQTTVVEPGDTFAIIARRFDMGYTELLEANPDVDPDQPKPGTVLVIPSQYVLPNSPHEGLTVNLSEMRLFYYPKGSHEVVTFPVGVGREGEETPQGVLRVIEHIPNPTWHVPESIRKIREAEGINLPKEVLPGPENPLGKYAMRLSNRTYLIHGTNDPYGGIGRRSSSGCLRLYPEDIQVLFNSVKKGTDVYIVDEPYKLGWSEGQIYLESHIPLKQEPSKDKTDEMIRSLVNQQLANKPSDINWQQAMEIAKEEQGMPQVIGHFAMNEETTQTQAPVAAPAPAFVARPAPSKAPRPTPAPVSASPVMPSPAVPPHVSEGGHPIRIETVPVSDAVPVKDETQNNDPRPVSEQLYSEEKRLALPSSVNEVDY